jgi:hypothetical protein
LWLKTYRVLYSLSLVDSRLSSLGAMALWALGAGLLLAGDVMVALMGALLAGVAEACAPRSPRPGLGQRVDAGLGLHLGGGLLLGGLELVVLGGLRGTATALLALLR